MQVLVKDKDTAGNGTISQNRNLALPQCGELRHNRGFYSQGKRPLSPMQDEQNYQNLRQTVTNLLVRIEENQLIQARFHDFEFQLLACRRFGELLEKILVGALKHFDLAGVSLVLHDPDYRVATLVEHLGIGNFSNRFQLRHSNDFFVDLYQHSHTVRLGQMDALTAARLFPGIDNVASAALLPLLRQQRPIGSLHFASNVVERYSADKAVSFMWHLASMVAICLENCIALEQLQKQGMEDILTQVKNRRCFEEEFAKELERADRQLEPLSCLFVDIDHFKSINDERGHQAGDLCLREVAHRISLQLRKTDLLARYGGEEFVVLLPSCKQKQALAIAERIRAVIAKQPIAVGDNKDGESVSLTVSAGLSTWVPREEKRHGLKDIGRGLLACADEAMYEAKKSGRDRVCVKEYVSQ